MEPDPLSYQDSWRCVMWLLSGIGFNEILFVIAVIASICCLGTRGMRWLVVVVPLLTFSVVASPPDLLSMLVIAVPLFLAFAFGSYWGPHHRPSQDDLTPFGSGVA
jgi:Sec-independent protein secretion pathway component TatC